MIRWLQEENNGKGGVETREKGGEDRGLTVPCDKRSCECTYSESSVVRREKKNFCGAVAGLSADGDLSFPRQTRRTTMSTGRVEDAGLAC